LTPDVTINKILKGELVYDIVTSIGSPANEQCEAGSYDNLYFCLIMLNYFP